MAVPVSVILERKGSDVVTVAPGTALLEAAQVLAERRIGALVVADEDGTVAGILSERDVVRCIASEGPACLRRPVAELMTTQVQTCSPDSTVDELMATMTGGRFRHVPVLAEGRLAGIVSIGDVVKSRLDELELHAESLEAYVTQPR